MTASERLAALDAMIDKEPSNADWGWDDDEIGALRNALPEIVAVVRAMEKLVEDGTAPITDEIVYVIRASTRNEIKSSIADLRRKLGGDVT